MNRRSFLLFSAALSLSRLSPALADALKALRIGYQKTGVLLVVKARRQLERRFESQGPAVRWVEFPSGPPLLEALSAGGVDFGYTGDTPPIFAQAGRANIRCVGVIPARGYGQAIIVPDAKQLLPRQSGLPRLACRHCRCNQRRDRGGDDMGQRESRRNRRAVLEGERSRDRGAKAIR